MDLAATLASLAAGQQRILALLADVTPRLAAGGEGRPDLAEAARTIAEATEWANNIKAAMATLLETAGQLIEGQKSGRKGLDTAVAGLKSREDALADLVRANWLEPFGEVTLSEQIGLSHLARSLSV